MFKCRRRSKIFEAIQWVGNPSTLKDFAVLGFVEDSNGHDLVAHTENGPVRCKIDDFILKDDAGSVQVHSSEIFNMLFEEV